MEMNETPGSKNLTTLDLIEAERQLKEQLKLYKELEVVQSENNASMRRVTDKINELQNIIDGHIRDLKAMSPYNSRWKREVQKVPNI